jgi:hypothetical protein
LACCGRYESLLAEDKAEYDAAIAEYFAKGDQLAKSDLCNQAQTKTGCRGWICV